MKIEIKLDAKKEPFFIERRRITSGRIARSGFEEYGVVFSGIGKPNEVAEEPPADLTASESDFQVAHLQGAMVGFTRRRCANRKEAAGHGKVSDWGEVVTR